MARACVVEHRDHATRAGEVFDYLADGENMPRWMKDFTAWSRSATAPVGQGTEFRYHDKRGTDSTFEWSEYQPPTRLAWHGAAVKMPGGSLEPTASTTSTSTTGTRMSRCTCSPARAAWRS